jgi:hypothetical protein
MWCGVGSGLGDGGGVRASQASRSGDWSAVELAAMADAQHQDHQFAALPRVDHPVVAYPHAPHAFEFTLERSSAQPISLGVMSARQRFSCWAACWGAGVA